MLGIALTYARYSTWKGPALHLEDLIVSEKYRGMGVGSALLDAVVRHGQALGVRRVSWEVLDWNEPAIEFYQSRGATILNEWNAVRLEGGAMERYWERNNG